MLRKHFYFYFLDNNESNACKAQLTELNDQEQNFAAMAKELACFNGNRITFQMFLQHCPDAITYLFDRCLMSIGKREQVSRMSKIYHTSSAFEKTH